MLEMHPLCRDPDTDVMCRDCFAKKVQKWFDDGWTYEELWALVEKLMDDIEKDPLLRAHMKGEISLPGVKI